MGYERINRKDQNTKLYAYTSIFYQLIRNQDCIVNVNMIFFNDCIIYALPGLHMVLNPELFS